MFKTKTTYPGYIGKNRIRQILINNDSFNSKKDEKPKIIIPRNSSLDSYLTFNKCETNSNLGSKISYEDYLLKKLSYFRKINRELKIQFNNISEKSKILFSDITKNKSDYLILKKEYENEIKINKEIKFKLNNILMKNENDKEINELKEEQDMLLITLQSKEKIINNLENTLNTLTKEIDEDKKMNESIINKKNNQIIELKQVLNDLNNKFEENNKIINSKKEEKARLKNKNQFLNYYLKERYNNNLNKKENQQNKENLSQNQQNNNNSNKNQNENNKIGIKKIKPYKKDTKIEKENNQVLLRNKRNNSFSNEQHLLTITEKTDNISCDSENNITKLPLINTHKRIKSNEINKKKQFEEIEHKIYYYTEGNIKKDMSKINHMNKESFYLYSINKEGKLIEFDLIEKKYIKINTKQIKDWNIFIPEYSSFYEGSLLLNTFQGLFILTGKFHKDLFYYSKKYNSISKINTFNYSHKYGGLILTPNCENIIAIGGETKEVEILNIENGQIEKLSNLLTKRINSAYSFIDNKLFAFFGKNNNQIEYLNMTNNKKWELIQLKKHDNKISNYEGLAAIPINKNEILFVGNILNNKAMKFNYNKLKIEYEDINIENNNKKYRFDKDKYFNNFINFEKIGKDGNYPSQFVGTDSMGNIHYFNSDFTYSIINYKKI